MNHLPVDDGSLTETAQYDMKEPPRRQNDSDMVDVIIFGTNLSHAILAAAIATAGKKVFIVDDAGQYGRQYSSFSLQPKEDEENEWRSWDKLVLKKKWRQNKEIIGHFVMMPQSSLPSSAESMPTESIVSSASLPTKEDAAFFDDMIRHIHRDDEFPSVSEKNKFMMNFSSFPLLAADPFLVPLLVSSQVASYVDFKLIDLVGSISKDNIFTPFPFSKETVFKDATLSLMDKRKYMKVMMDAKIFFNQYSDQTLLDTGERNETWSKIMSMSIELSPLIRYLVCGCQSENDVEGSVLDEVAFEHALIFFQSLGKFGPSPLLFPNYDVNEYVTGFCRRAAVHGGTVMLNANIKYIQFPTGIDDKFTMTLQDGSIWQSLYLIAEPYLFESQLTFTERYRVYRHILVSKEPIRHISKKNGLEDNGLAYMIIPPNTIDNSCLIHVLHLNVNANACPSDYYITHLYSQAPFELNDLFLSLLFLSSQGALLESYRFKEVVQDFTFNMDFPVQALLDKQLFISRQQAVLAVEQSWRPWLNDLKSIFHSICTEQEEWFPRETQSNENEEDFIDL